MFDNGQLNRAVTLRDRGDCQAALEELRCIVRDFCTDEEKASLLLNEATCYVRLGLLQEARLSVRAARILLSDVNSSLWLYADWFEPNLLATEGKFDEAITAFLKLQQVYSELLADPEHSELAKDITERLAFNLVNAGRTDEALPRLLDLAENKKRGSQRVHFYLGLCYRLRLDFHSAEREFLSSLEGPDLLVRADAYYELGFLLLQAGRIADSKASFDQALAIGKSSYISPLRVQEALGIIANKTGERENRNL